MALKHVGRMVRNQRKVVVAYRTIPGDAESCVVVTTENLMADEHDSLMRLVESNAGQTAEELGLAMARAVLPDGRNMLAAFHTTGKMVKAKTSEVEMMPDNRTVINLAELNKIIAEQKGVSIEDLAVKDDTPRRKEKIDLNPKVDEDVTELATAEPLQASENEVLTDEQLAAQYRSQADAMFKEAKKLREQAEELVPTKRKTKKTEESA
jgi:hypothetical protein